MNLFFLKKHKIPVIIVSVVLILLLSAFCVWILTDGAKKFTETNAEKDGSSLSDYSEENFSYDEKSYSGTDDPFEQSYDEQNAENTDKTTSKASQSTSSGAGAGSNTKPTAKAVIIKSCAPKNKMTLSPGDYFGVLVTARRGSTVKAVFNGETVVLEADSGNGEFADYTGGFTLPKNVSETTDFGKVKFIAEHGSSTDTDTTGKIICNVKTVETGEYIAEVVAYAAETFDGNTFDDASRPTNNFLPKGTVDYCSSEIIKDTGKTHRYYKLRCGKRVYLEYVDNPLKTTTQVTQRYKGKLPDHNEIGFSSINVSGNRTVITFDSMWKAPFFLDVLPQNYRSTKANARDYTFDTATYNYVEISFCYATKYTGNTNFIPADNPLFSRVEIFQKSDCCVMRLYLKQTGGFYGWTCNYNANGQLCFNFLNPTKVNTAANTYGADLSGIKIMLDVGHGGSNSGTAAGSLKESDCNLILAKKIKAQLESIGATVKLNRSGDSTLTESQRCSMLWNEMPDLCIAVHHDGNVNAALNGCGVYHFDAFSHNAAISMFNSINQSGIYGKCTLKWHYYYVARTPACPVVLTENGYMSNPTDLVGIKSNEKNDLKAAAITRGVANYFLSLK